MFNIEKINKSYGTYKVLDDINLHIPEDKLVSIIGPNGAGKSTLLGVISRIAGWDNGQVHLKGRDINTWDREELSKTLSIMKQSHSTGMRLTIHDLVSFGRYPYSKGRLTSEDVRKIDEAIEYSGLTEIKDKYMDELSGGQRQRAYIAMVLAQDTRYILLDEPLNNLDMKHILEVMTLLRKLVDDQGKSVIIVIHDINIASTYSDHIIAMKDGAVAHKGTPHEIIDREILRSIYDINFGIETVNDKRICLYY